MTVKTMAACGISQDEIARCIGTSGIAPKTLREHFRNELSTAVTQVNALAGSQVIAAMKRGEAWATCFWLKCRARWSERQTLEVSGSLSITDIEQAIARGRERASKP